MSAKLTRAPASWLAAGAMSPGRCGRIRSSGTPVSACSFGSTSIAVTVPSKGARSVDSIFIASRTISRSPAATSWPSSTATETTRAGHCARTAMPSSRSTRCATPSSSSRQPVPCEATITACASPAAVTVHSNASFRSLASSTTRSPVSTLYVRGPVWKTRSGYCCPWYASVVATPAAVTGSGRPRAARAWKAARCVSRSWSLARTAETSTARGSGSGARRACTPVRWNATAASRAQRFDSASSTTTAQSDSACSSRARAVARSRPCATTLSTAPEPTASPGDACATTRTPGPVGGRR